MLAATAAAMAAAAEALLRKRFRAWARKALRAARTSDSGIGFVESAVVVLVVLEGERSREQTAEESAANEFSCAEYGDGWVVATGLVGVVVAAVESRGVVVKERCWPGWSTRRQPRDSRVLESARSEQKVHIDTRPTAVDGRLIAVGGGDGD